MANRPRPTPEDKRRIGLRSQLASGYFTGRAIALLILCGLAVWFLFLQAASAEAFKSSNALLTLGPQPSTMGLAVIK